MCAHLYIGRHYKERPNKAWVIEPVPANNNAAKSLILAK